MSLCFNIWNLKWNIQKTDTNSMSAYFIVCGSSSSCWIHCCTWRQFSISTRYGVCLIGVRRADSKTVLLNPGSSFLMGYNDTCFYISMSSEEESSFKERKEPTSKCGSSADFTDASEKVYVEMSETRSNGASKSENCRFFECFHGDEKSVTVVWEDLRNKTWGNQPLTSVLSRWKTECYCKEINGNNTT